MSTVGYVHIPLNKTTGDQYNNYWLPLVNGIFVLLSDEVDSSVPSVKKQRLATTSEVSKLPIPSGVLAMFGDKQGVCII